MKKLIIPLFLLTIIFSGCIIKQTAIPQACDTDAKVCPDGSTVVRTLPNCEFAPCPTVKVSPTPIKACTMEAKMCPDGSAVGRSGLNCEFAPCPGEGQTGCTTSCTCPA